MTEIYKILVMGLLFYRTAASDVQDTYYPRYHLAPCKGWMNDPNGFCRTKNGVFHMFFQYNPETSQEAGIAHWGHSTSPDLFTWQHQPIAMYPNDTYDKTGVFSGSALVEDGKMYFFYTGNVNHPNEDPDHEQHQALAESSDGVTVTKYSGNPIIISEEHQPNIRDPKVWKHDDTYYMVLGNSFKNNTLGRILLYASDDKITWKQVSVLGESKGFLGYMWECPDFFELNGYYVLLFSPQGVEPKGDMYRNLYQTGYIIGTFDYVSYKFTPITPFKEIDHGHDFYATQTILEGDRRIMMAWFDMWERIYPERNTGFTGCMTLPRELTLGPKYEIYQRPVRETREAIGCELTSGEGKAGDIVELEDKTAEIVIRAPRAQDLVLFIESYNQTVVLSYDFVKGTVTLDRGGDDGIRRTKWRPKLNSPGGSDLYWRIFIDASTVELFCGDGEVTFSSRFFPLDSVKIRLGSNVYEFTVNSMKRTAPMPGACYNDDLY